MITFDILGCPAPKGSNRAILRGGRARFVPGGSTTNQRKQKSWDVAVREAAISALSAKNEPLPGPLYCGCGVTLSVTFRLIRPAGHWATGKNAGRLKPSAPEYPAVAPDVDKLARQIGDSLTGILYDDDSRIVVLHVAKRYADHDEGATVTVAAASELDRLSHPPSTTYRQGLDTSSPGFAPEF